MNTRLIKKRLMLRQRHRLRIPITRIAESAGLLAAPSVIDNPSPTNLPTLQRTALHPQTIMRQITDTSIQMYSRLLRRKTPPRIIQRTQNNLLRMRRAHTLLLSPRQMLRNTKKRKRRAVKRPFIHVRHTTTPHPPKPSPQKETTSHTSHHAIINFQMNNMLSTEAETHLTTFLKNRKARINNLYWILDKNGKRTRFRMNWAQDEFYHNMHSRNTVLKVRQLGISTLIAIYILDSMLFNTNWNAAIVDKTLTDAQEKVAKIAFAYSHLDYLPPNPTDADRDLAHIGSLIKQHFAEPKANGDLKQAEPKKGEFRLKNGSRVQASTSGRGGTLQFLHVSELGYIAMHDPSRAREIVTGSFNTVGQGGIIVQESTHEGGKFGLNYEQIMQAMSNIGRPLSPLDFKFFFFPWYKHPDYKIADHSPHETPDDSKYFSSLQSQLHINLSTEQRAWYLSMKKTQGTLMRQEYPSTPEEALNPIVDGTIYCSQIMTLRERGHYAADFQHDPHRPIYTAWDFGISDYTVIWWLQPDGAGRWFVLDCYTANNQPFSHYINILRERDAQFSRCALCICPHDVSKRDLHLSSYGDELQKAGYSVTRIPATSNQWVSIDHTRELLLTCIFHERCSNPTHLGTREYISGMNALANYRMPDNAANGTISLHPLHNEASHAADALRTFADAVHLGYITPTLGWLQPPTPKELRAARAFVDNMLTV